MAPPAAASRAGPGRLSYLSQGCLHAAAHGALIEVSVPIAPTLGRVFCLISSGIGRQPLAAVRCLAGLARQSGPVLAALASGGRPPRGAGLGGQGPQGRYLAAVADHDEDLPACDLRRGRRVGAEFPARVPHGQHQGPGPVVDPGAAQRLPGQR